LAGAPQSMADDETTVTETTIGQSAELVDGNLVQSWIITDLGPSSDVIPYVPQGTLWEATATNEAVQGSIQPIVSNLNARSADGENYRVLFGVATSQGVNPAALAQGEKTSGKLYFDVTGADPDSVVYNAGGQDLVIWAPAPPASPASGGSGSWSPPATGGDQSAPAPAETAPAPATGSTGTPITEGMPGTEAPEAGSSGTPITEGEPMTPAPEAGSSGTPITEGTPTTPAPGAAAPAPEGGSAGTPVEGSAGTPMVEAVPTTTEVPHGAQYAPAS